MSDDYLFDGTGAPDPEVERLERMLGRLRITPTVPPRITVRLPPAPLRGFGGTRKPDTTDVHTTDVHPADVHTTDAHTTDVNTRIANTYVGWRFLGPALSAAAAIALMVGLTWRNAAPPASAGATAGKASWDVSVLVGTPRIGTSAVTGEGRIAVGETLTTDEGSRAMMEVGDIGQVTVDERTRVRLVETREGHHRLALERGTLHAVIAAPPGQFVVSTPSATATDLGCVYVLHVNDDGSGMLTVEAGWVAFEERGRESFVPSGASSRTDRVNGPGTPRYDDTELAFRDALDDVDNGGDAARKAASLRFVLDHARVRDAMTLWHLIARVTPADRPAVVDALAARVAAPAPVTRDAVLRLDRAALDQWWDALGLDEATWWRKWKQPLAAGAGTQRSPALAADSCPVTPTVHETPPPDSHADGFGSGPWHVNTDRTIWMQNGTFPEWRQGLNQKVMAIKPVGVVLTVAGVRLDSPADPLTVDSRGGSQFGFNTMALTFPTAGCWNVTAKAGDREMSFIAIVRPRP